MSHRALFLADGPSDIPLAGHIEGLCRRHGIEMDVVAVPADRLPRGTGRRVNARVKAVLHTDPAFDCVFVHRDAESQDPAQRYREVRDGVRGGGFTGASVAVVPIRMTEAWLLLDEPAIRRVAGRPTGTLPLDLPTLAEVERLADPKRRLQETLVSAAHVSGRRLQTFRARFSEHRRQLLEQLDMNGAVSRLHAWQALEHDVTQLATKLRTT